MATTTYQTFDAAARAIGARTDAASVAVEDMSASEDRMMNVLRTGYLTEHDAFVVTPDTGMTLAVGSGNARRDEYAVQGTEAGQGTYLARLDVGSVSLTLDAADPGSARTDAIYLVVTDKAYDGGTLSLVRLAIRKGDVGAGAPGPDAGWSAYALLATINVGPGVTTINAGDVADQRVPATFRAGVPVGQLNMFAGAVAPPGWLLCQGQAVSRTTYAALFAVLGTTYGAGDGTTTFNLPDMRTRFPVGVGTGYARGATGGEAQHTLTTAELPSHTHGDGSLATNTDTHNHTTDAAGVHDHDVRFSLRTDVSSTGGAVATERVEPWALSGGSTQDTSDAGSHTHSVNNDSHNHDVTGATGATGSGAAHENRPPFVAVNFLIYAGA